MFGLYLLGVVLTNGALKKDTSQYPQRVKDDRLYLIISSLEVDWERSLVV